MNTSTYWYVKDYYVVISIVMEFIKNKCILTILNVYIFFASILALSPLVTTEG